jgi:hypothetical protein
MAGNPLKHRVLSALAARAKSELGDDASVLDYAYNHVANGGTIVGLANLVGLEIGLPISRSFLSGILNNLNDDARMRLEAARRESASALAEQTTEIADAAEAFPASIAKAGLQVRTRQWLAERFAPEQFGQKSSVAVTANVGQLMLEALRVPVDQLRAIRDDADREQPDDRRPPA